MSKINASRIKRVAQQRQESLKEQRRIRKLALAGAAAGRRVAAKKAAEAPARAFIAGAKNLIMAGVGPIVDGLGALASAYKATVAGAGDTAGAATSNKANLDWRAQAVMSAEGLYRPVSKFGGMNTSKTRSSGMLPQYSRRRYNSSYEGSLQIPLAARTGTNASGPFSPHPPVFDPEIGGTGYDPLAIYQEFLDPFATPSTAKHLEAGVSPTEIHHDVDSVAWGGQNPTDQTLSLLENANDGAAFPDDFRMMALRGPLLINGWGYDLEGKPIPNSADTVAGATRGEFVDTNLTNSFASGWLRRSELWPVAPLDLRFDRVRGVWTTPPPYRVLFGEIAQTMAGGHKGPGSETGIANVWTTEFPAGPDGGTLFQGGEDPRLIFTNVLNTSGLKSGDKAYFHWDPNSATYYPIVDLSSSGGSPSVSQYKDLSVCDTSGTIVTGCSGIACLTMSTGLSISYVSDDINGTGYHLKTDMQISDREYCGYNPNITEGRFFKMLALGSGLQLEDTANCTYTINAEQSISDTDYCDWTATVEDKFFNKLIMGNGLQVVDNTDCSYTINADHLVSKIDCEDNEDIAPTLFNQLTFHTGIDVQQLDANTCAFTISSAHKVRDDAVCGQSSNVATFNKYENLSFRSGLKLDSLGSCDFSVDADMKLKDSIANSCVRPIEVSAYKNFTNLNFGSGLHVFEDTENCEYTIHSSNQATIRSDPWCSAGGSLPAVFTGLSIGTGLKLVNTAGCDFSIQANLQIKDSVSTTCVTSTVPNYVPYNKLSLGSGLTLVTDVSNCEYTINAFDITKHYDYGSQGQGGESLCNIAGGNGLVNQCPGGIVFGYGLDAGLAPADTALDQMTVVNKIMNVEAPLTSQGYVRKVETIDLGCGLSGVHNGDTCAADGVEITSVQIAINPLSDQGTIQSVDVINGICCTGAHITASFLTLRFTSCGLFIEATGGTGCCS
jgi:hypothetical protein